MPKLADLALVTMTKMFNRQKDTFSLLPYPLYSQIKWLSKTEFDQETHGT